MRVSTLPPIRTSSKGGRPEPQTPQQGVRQRHGPRRSDVRIVLALALLVAIPIVLQVYSWHGRRRSGSLSFSGLPDWPNESVLPPQRPLKVGHKLSFCAYGLVPRITKIGQEIWSGGTVRGCKSIAFQQERIEHGRVGERGGGGCC